MLRSKFRCAITSSGSLGDSRGEFTAVGAAVGGWESGNMARHSGGPLGRRSLGRLPNLCFGGVFLGDCSGEFATEFSAVGAAVGGCESGNIARHSAGPLILGLLTGSAGLPRCSPYSGLDPPSIEDEAEELAAGSALLLALPPVAPVKSRLTGGTVIRTAMCCGRCASSPCRGLSGEVVDPLSGETPECCDPSEPPDTDGSLGGGNID